MTNAVAVSDAPRSQPQPLGLINTIDDIDIRHLRYFLAVARLGSVSGAAAELNVSQPSLSQQIIRLERRIGFDLFERKPRGVSLTTSGDAFLRGVERIPYEIRDAITAASPRPATITIGICAGISYPRIAEVLEMIRQSVIAEGGSCEAPIFQLRSITSSSQGSCLRVGDIDLGVVRLPLTDPRLTLLPFSVEELGVVMAAGHRLAEYDSITWAELGGQRLLWVDPSHPVEHSRALLEEIRQLGWDPILEGVDDHRPELTIHALQNAHPDTVAIRPQAAFQDYPNLQWRPISGIQTQETLAVAALAGTRHSALVEQLTLR